MNIHAAKLAAYQHEARSFARGQAAWDNMAPDVPEDEAEDDHEFEPDYEREDER